MVVGVMELHLALYDNTSLKDKRSTIKRITQRCRNEFNISVSEVAAHDQLDRAVLGFVTVSNDRNIAQSLLDQVENFVDRLALATLLQAKKAVENY